MQAATSLRSTSSSKLDVLTSLRLPAAVVVVVHHSTVFILPSSISVPVGEAITFFFVLSGFILTYAYHQRSYGRQAYYVARVSRILPASLLSIATYIILVNPTALSLDSHNLPILGSNLLLLQSLVPVPRYYFALNAVLWSVSVECCFYAFFPHLQRLLSNGWGKIVLLVAPVAVGIGIVALSSHLNLPVHSDATINAVTWTGMIYINPLSRMKEFALGMLAGAAFLKIRRAQFQSGLYFCIFSILEIAALASLIWGVPVLNWIGSVLAYRISLNPVMLGAYIGQALTAGFFAAVILLFACQAGAVSRLLEKKAFVLGGEISFSVYLFHQILLIWQSKNPWVLGWVFPQFRFPIFFVAVMVVSYVVWRWFECPMRVLIRRIFDRR